jgi:hypothetical protein
VGARDGANPPMDQQGTGDEDDGFQRDAQTFGSECRVARMGVYTMP